MYIWEGVSEITLSGRSVCIILIYLCVFVHTYMYYKNTHIFAPIQKTLWKATRWRVKEFIRDLLHSL